jgi:hypothetical protein
MPKGQNSKVHMLPELMMLRAICDCGRVFDGKAAVTDKLFLLHQKKCPWRHKTPGVYVAEVNHKGDPVATRGKRLDRLLRAAEAASIQLD